MNGIKPCTRLKPCPFCGSHPIYTSDGGFNAEIKCQKCQQAIVKSIWYDGDLGTTEKCWEIRKTEETMQAELSRRDAVIRELRGVLTLLYGKYENGDPCYEIEDGEADGSYLGNAVQLFPEEDAFIEQIMEKTEEWK